MTRKTLTVEETARILGLSRGAAYKAVRRGEIPAIRLGKRWVVSMEALSELLRGRREATCR